MTDRAPDTTRITELLLAVSDGRQNALNQLSRSSATTPARGRRADAARSPGHSLQPTALVHEAYVRLVDQRHVKWTIAKAWLRADLSSRST